MFDYMVEDAENYIASGNNSYGKSLKEDHRDLNYRIDKLPKKLQDLLKRQSHALEEYRKIVRTETKNPETNIYWYNKGKKITDEDGNRHIPNDAVIHIDLIDGHIYIDREVESLEDGSQEVSVSIRGYSLTKRMALVSEGRHALGIRFIGIK